VDVGWRLKGLSYERRALRRLLHRVQNAMRVWREASLLSTQEAAEEQQFETRQRE
jgi:hypothetical protein